eukprot:scaffold1761_cov357-Prasinococcus_capsulatus_cf.AAC.1
MATSETYFDKAKTHLEQACDGLPVLVEASCKPNWVAETESPEPLMQARGVNAALGWQKALRRQFNRRDMGVLRSHAKPEYLAALACKLELDFAPHFVFAGQQVSRSSRRSYAPDTQGVSDGHRGVCAERLPLKADCGAVRACLNARSSWAVFLSAGPPSHIYKHRACRGVRAPPPSAYERGR